MNDTALRFYAKPNINQSNNTRIQPKNRHRQDAVTFKDHKHLLTKCSFQRLKCHFFNLAFLKHAGTHFN